MLTAWQDRPLDDLLAAHELRGAPEEPFPNDGWSGAALTRLRRSDESFVLKRTSWAVDWIARATRDHALREALVAGGALDLPATVRAPYHGAAADGNAAALLMPDLTGVLLPWEEPIGPVVLEAILGAMAALHAAAAPASFPWCPLRERLELLGPAAAARYRDGGLAVGERFLAGWAELDRRAPAAARDLIGRLAADARPLVAALDRLPPALLHGDLKLANVGPVDGGIVAIDWQMVSRGPIAVDLGWFLVSNVGSLPIPPDSVLTRYRALAADADPGEWAAQVDLTWLVGLLLRGWRKGLDAASTRPTGWGATADDDLAWWCRRAVEAADRRL